MSFIIIIAAIIIILASTSSLFKLRLGNCSLHWPDPAMPAAPLHRIPPTSLVTIEYPGPVASSSASQKTAIETLGGLPRLSRALYKAEGVVELNFRPGVTFSHTIGGTTVEGRNMVLIKVSKKRRRTRAKDRMDGLEENGDRQEETGVYTVQAVGTVRKVVRFRGTLTSFKRSLMDVNATRLFQPWQIYNTNLTAQKQIPPLNSRMLCALWTASLILQNLVQHACAQADLNRLPVDTLQAYRFPEPFENFESDLRLLPPPVFSRLSLSQIYAFVCFFFTVTCPQALHTKPADI